MKRLVLWVCAVGLSVSVFAQTKEVTIATDKTVSLIFPFPIRHVDRGTKDVLVQQVKEADNILLLKAGVKNFQPTNLSVFTADGSSYSFAVNFQEKPLIWIYEIPAQIETSVQTYASGILDNPRTMKGLRDRKWEMSFAITGIYIKANVIYYQLRLDNNSPIDYDIDFLRFYIRDRKKGKRTASQENEVKPIYTAGNTTCVKAIDENMIVVALDKFTIPDAKYLAIEINERSGGRHLLLKVGNRKIIQAVPLPDLH